VHFPASRCRNRGERGARGRFAPVAPDPSNSREFRPYSPNDVWSGRRDLNPRHSAWEADARRRYPTHPQRVTSSPIHPLPRPLPRPASSCCTSLHNRPSERVPRATSVSRVRRHPWPAERAARARSGHTGGTLEVATGRAARGGWKSATAVSGRGPPSTNDRDQRRPAASRARRELHGRRPRPARPSPSAHRLTESLVEIASQPRDAPGPRCVRAPRGQRGLVRTAPSSSSPVRLPIAMRSRLAATAQLKATAMGSLLRRPRWKVRHSNQRALRPPCAGEELRDRHRTRRSPGQGAAAVLGDQSQ
jgi:hypothetical protein